LKQVVQNFKTGEILVEEVPPPRLGEGFLLVENRASLISAGTEGGTVRLGKMSYLGKARSRPEQVKKVIQAVQTEGLMATYQAVNRTLDVPVPLGYSCAGVVIEASPGLEGMGPGTAVACGGAGRAFHAEVVAVPRNLCVPVPKGVCFAEAAFTTVGAIALQAVRITDLRLGENVVVIGLGLVGLLAVELLRAGGMRVFGIDTDPRRIDWVRRNSTCPAELRGASSLKDAVLEFTSGLGADAVLICAGSPNNDPVALAGEIARHKGRVVVVGRTVMEAPRETYLFKELELRTSYAYGPGVDDPSYEIEGYDYPPGYVRWTENRNMACFLDFLAQERIRITPYITHRFPVDKAAEAFDCITAGKEQPIGVVLEYGIGGKPATAQKTETTSAPVKMAPGRSRLRIGIIGAGSFATNIMLPAIAARKDIDLVAIASAGGLKAAALGKKYGIPRITSAAEEILHATDIDCVFVLTRHGSHGLFAKAALEAGKHVFVEKPLALTETEYEGVLAAWKTSGTVLMVGFNRRFSPLAVRMREFFSERRQPMVLDFRANVGYRPPDHWLHDPAEGGGIILGEVCHYIDFCRWMTDSPILRVRSRCVGHSATAIIAEDNVEVDLDFEDGSIATILYVSNGARGFGRERCEVHAEGKSAVWEDFRYLRRMKDLRWPNVTRNRLFPRKGYAKELEAFFGAIRSGDPDRGSWIASQIDASLAAIQAAVNLAAFK